LGERLDRTQEVGGSSPPSSTSSREQRQGSHRRHATKGRLRDATATPAVHDYSALVARPSDNRRDVTMGSQANKDVVQQFYDQWSSGAIDFERLVHQDITNHQPDRDPETGLDAFRLAIEGVMRAVPDSNWKTLRLIADEDFVVCHNKWSGTYEGEVFRGIPAARGKRFSVEHVHIYRIIDSRIAEHWVVRDDLGMLLQTGAISTSG
jgi:predicted ester cyclase